MTEIELIIRDWPGGLAAIQDAVASLEQGGHITSAVADACNLVLEELIANAFVHGSVAEARLQMRCSATELVAVVADSGERFNPLEEPDPDIEAGLDERRLGGLGIFFVKRLMDRVEYRRVGDQNQVILTKQLEAR